ncbi:GlcNAc-PI de-N-acetylase [Metarhizium robertsii]|uniref:N-acetylglucosaminylphosphatidylinositol deacetylase n=2 Tax=Metarhizium robertsii TaxID=568076 RepID=E9FBB9_METRA|nr:N-acetylglucosaminyl phosphatidylinositol deacetylase [Metarhizium robertsii ARSEF 23]EFY94990.1 N-acetylglucosaminyl phosphatidylinositol deacetylase [Metarhizium robertsii ARSEF 23]EXU96413.1 GlcNAc-PI de-N-acetylase [Metarhizium robertsii]
MVRKLTNAVQPISRACHWLVATRVRRRWFLRIALIVCLFPLFLQWFLAYMVGGDARLLPPELSKAKNLLIVTAHPDDECLFFSPSILGVLDRNKSIKGGLVVMSTGNNYGLGETRKKELLGSCAALGIDTSRCVALDHPDLQDNPKVWWEEAKIKPILKEYIEKWDIDAIITFDEGGVSGHINHRAVSSAVNQYVAENEKAPASYMVVSVALPRKYTFLLDLPLTALSFLWRILAAVFFPSSSAEPKYSTRALITNTWHRYRMTRRAFASHGSQYTWDRHLYMIISRYVWFNDLRRIVGTATTA